MDPAHVLVAFARGATEKGVGKSAQEGECTAISAKNNADSDDHLPDRIKTCMLHSGLPLNACPRQEITAGRTAFVTFTVCITVDASGTGLHKHRRGTRNFIQGCRQDTRRSNSRRDDRLTVLFCKPALDASAGEIHQRRSTGKPLDPIAPADTIPLYRFYRQRGCLFSSGQDHNPVALVNE